MALPVPSVLRPAVPRLAPSCGEALLHRLDAAEPDWHALGELALRDVTLCYPLLTAQPLLHADEAADLGTALAARLARAGTAVLRAWLLTSPLRTANSVAYRPGLVRAALTCAECAHHLAIETGHPRPREAYLAGMWRELGRALSADDPQSGGQLAANLARACGLPRPVADALLIEQALDEVVSAAHPLARILWSASRLAADPAAAMAPRLAAMSRLPAESLASLRADVAFITDEKTAHDESSAPSSPDTTHGLPAALHAAALDGLLGTAFTALDESGTANRLQFASRLLHGYDAPLLLATEEDGRLTALAGTDARLRTWIGELGLDRDDEASVITLALRGRTLTTQTYGDGFSGRSPHDWQIARWLDASAITCVPLGAAPCPAVAVFPLPPELLPPDGQAAALTTLLTHAVGHLHRLQADRTADAARDAAMRARYQQHARALVHEASNPLTVIRSYVGLLEQRNRNNAPLQGDLRMIGNELDRIGELLERLTSLSEDEEPETACCDLAPLLDDIRALCETPLFRRHGIHFELRRPVNIAPVAMPASRLRQVLLNLLRNASEALSPGSRCALAVAGQLVVDDRPCVEIRLIDNGPGLPPERVNAPFAAGRSTKDGAHRGMGLAIVREILAAWQATVVCRSQPGTGISFQLFIPVAKAP